MRLGKLKKKTLLAATNAQFYNLCILPVSCVFLQLCILIIMYALFCVFCFYVPAGTLRLP